MSAPKTRKSAQVSQAEYDDPKMQARFADIAASIRERDEDELGFTAADATVRQLSVLTGQIRAFAEVALGRASRPASRRMGKLPHRVFFDYKPRGALDVMLCTVLSFKAVNEIRRLDFTNIEKLDFHVDLLVLIENNLLSAGLLPKIHVYFSRAVPAGQLPGLHRLVKKRATVATDASEATHIIYPDPPNTTEAETDGTDFCRSLENKGDLAFVHWWYYPDSYDCWVEKTVIDGDPEEEEDHKGPWHVQIRWLRDTEMFNEYMNEVDYEVPREDWIDVASAPKADPVASSGGAAKTVLQPADEERRQAERDKKSRKRKRSSSSKDRDTEAAPRARSSTDRPPRERDRTKEKRHRERERRRERERERERERSKARREDGRADGEDRGGKESSRDRKRRPEARRERDRARSSDGAGPSGRALSPADSPRKRPRTSDERRHARPASVKLRLPLTPAAADRGRERERKKERHERRERAEDGDEKKSALKVRVRLMPQGRDASKGTGQKKVIAKEEDGVEKMEIEPAGKAKSHKGSGESKKGKEDGGKRGEGSSSGKDKASPRADRNNSGDDKDRKRKKNKNKGQGVSFVENAMPIREVEISRIRNISEESGSVSKDDDESMADMEKSKKSSSKKDLEMKEEVTFAGDKEGKEDDKTPTEPRTRAVSLQGLLGTDAGQPIMAADVAEALPEVTVRLPAQACWFRMDSIHDIEKRALPEFFNRRSASKTPKVYKVYRDFMIDCWRQSPEKYLSATAARRHLAGDVCAILRVHSFLEHWGLLNYGVIPESRPHYNIAAGPMSWRPKPVQVDRAVQQNANGVPRLLFFNDPKPPSAPSGPVSLKTAMNNAKTKAGTVTPLATRQEVYATASAIKHNCDNCAIDCSKMRYECVGSADVKLCPLCFANGRYPSTLSSRDFEQLTTVLNSEAYDGSVWSEVENLLLLEGLEKFGDDWNKVADHVQTKSNEQCLLQFLRLPIEDSFLGDQVGKWNSTSESTTFSKVSDASINPAKNADDPAFAGPALPFADASNPIMAQVAFLASSVSPDVAAAAAQAALTQIMKDTVGASKKNPPSNTEMAKKLLKGDTAEKEGESPKGAPSANGKPNMDKTSLDGVAVEAAAAVGIAAAAARAKVLAEAETEDIERSFAMVIETKMRSIDAKLREFGELERHMRAEKDRLAVQRQRVYADRVASAMALAAQQQAAAQPAQSQAQDVPMEAIPSLQATVPAMMPGHQVLRAPAPAVIPGVGEAIPGVGQAIPGVAQAGAAFAGTIGQRLPGPGTGRDILNPVAALSAQLTAPIAGVGQVAAGMVAQVQQPMAAPAQPGGEVSADQPPAEAK